MSNIDFNSMSSAQIRAYAKDELGVSFPVTLKKAELIAKIGEYGTEASTAPVGEGSASEGNEDKTPKSVVINIPQDSDARNFYLIGVNGKNYQLKKGADVTVPYSVFDALKCAVEGVPVKVKDEQGNEKVEMRLRPRIPFSVIKNIY